MGAKLPCAVNKRAMAKFQDELKSQVNHELYFFADPEAKRKFDERPWKYCGTVTDPVSRERFAPDKKSLREDWMGRPYFFRTDSTRVAFLADPTPYAMARPMSAPARTDSTAADSSGATKGAGAAGASAEGDSSGRSEKETVAPQK